MHIKIIYFNYWDDIKFNFLFKNITIKNLNIYIIYIIKIAYDTYELKKLQLNNYYSSLLKII